MQSLDIDFPLLLYSELHAIKLFDQGSSNVPVNTISKYPPSHLVAYPIDM